MIDYERHNTRQRAYFEARSKATMRPRDSPYVHRHLDEFLTFANLRPGARIIEVGCGEGRYTLPLAARGFAVEGLDLAPILLERLAAADPYHPPLHAGDVMAPPTELEGRFEAAIGFFTLHHLHDLDACFAGIARLVRPGGVVAFLEPNPFNPLYYVQIGLTPGMTWEGDGGIVRMRPRVLDRAARAAGLEGLAVRRFGFFPPFVANRPRGARIERVLERGFAWRSALPFTLVRWERP